MKWKTHWWLMVAVLASVCLMAWSGYGQKQRAARATWEYKILDLRQEGNIDQTLNTLGAQGWELVSVQSDGTTSGTYFLKRAK